MAYRDAGAGIVVVTKAYAQKRQQSFDRLGSNRIVVVVDRDDEESGFLPLEVAYVVLRDSLLAKKKTETNTGPALDAAEDTITQIGNSINAAQSMKLNCTEAKKNIESVRNDIEKMEGEIRERLQTLKRQLGL